jgi:Nuclease-related domain
VPTKLLSVQRPGVCRSCGFELRVGTEAWYDTVAERFECASCAGSVFQGVERRSRSRIAKVAKFFGDSDVSSDGAERVHRERMLSVHLHTELGHRAVVLDDRKVPGTKVQIDHIVIAPSGVWVVDANEYDGRVERRDVGGWFKVDERLYVAGKDRTSLVDGIDRQVMAVEQVLAKEGLDLIPVHAALCFVNSEWGWFAKPFSLNGVWVTWATKLTELVLDWNAIPNTEIDRLARVVGSKLPSAA